MESDANIENVIEASKLLDINETFEEDDRVVLIDQDDDYKAGDLGTVIESSSNGSLKVKMDKCNNNYEYINTRSYRFKKLLSYEEKASKILG